MMSSTPPPTISGPAHGVLESSGHTMRIWFGAGAVPSLAMITLTLLGTFMRVTFASGPANSSSHRSEPAGFGPLTGCPFAVPETTGGGVVDGAVPVDDWASSAGWGATLLLVRLPLVASYFSVA